MDNENHVRIKNLILGLAEDLKPELERKNLHFRYLLENITCPEFEADGEPLKRALTELLTNAIQFTPRGGDVILTASEIMRRENALTLEFTVQDDGIGMTQEKLDETMNAPAGSLKDGKELKGLAYVRAYAADLGATVLAESGSELGTVVRLILEFPLPKDSSTVSVQKLSRDYYHFEGKKVLLVEDHPLNREIAGNMLKRVGVEVAIAANGEEAVEQFRKNGKDYDLILMDIRMPVMDGIRATHEIRALESGEGRVPIIALTASAYEGDSVRSRDAGMDEAILKPIDPGKMYRVLSKYLYPKMDQLGAAE